MWGAGQGATVPSHPHVSFCERPLWSKLKFKIQKYFEKRSFACNSLCNPTPSTRSLCSLSPPPLFLPAWYALTTSLRELCGRIVPRATKGIPFDGPRACLLLTLVACFMTAARFFWNRPRYVCRESAKCSCTKNGRYSVLSCTKSDVSFVLITSLLKCCIL